jgi:hypothetical protein
VCVARGAEVYVRRASGRQSTGIRRHNEGCGEMIQIRSSRQSTTHSECSDQINRATELRENSGKSNIHQGEEGRSPDNSPIWLFEDISSPDFVRELLVGLGS